jgi:S1-C subfamily serine protease
VSALAEIQESITTVAARQGPAVVGVGRGWRSGTGMVVGTGRVLTAIHNTGEGAGVTLADGSRSEAELVGVDRDLGIAVVAAETGDAERLEWAAGETEVESGMPVIALANPGGRGLRATLGFVSATDRSFRAPRGRRIRGAIEHTASLPRGSAGGPLLDSEGRLVGVNAVRVEGGLILSLGVQSGVRAAVERLSRGEEPDRPRLGVAVAPPYVARRLRRAVGLPERDGVLVRQVESGSPADRAGLAEGDLIVAAAGRDLDGIDALHLAVDEAVSRGDLSLGVLRGSDEREIQVELASEAA